MIKSFYDARDFVKKWMLNREDHAYYWPLDALYNQAITGDINYKRPNLLTKMLSDPRKWDAWNALKGMPRETAMKNYISMAEKAYCSIFIC